jgi:hypothetical protein
MCKQGLGLFIKSIHKGAPRNENLGSLEVRGNDCWICHSAGMILQITHERICCGRLE